MRIGIITYWQTVDNYGQLLQCWALQQTLINMGHAPYLIRYDIENRRRVSPLWKQILKLPLWFVFKRRSEARLKIREQYLKENEVRGFSDFRNDNICKSDNVYTSIEQLRNNPPEADAYIVGSDQVWGRLPNDKDNDAYYLAFGGKQLKRIGYAVSFGFSTYPLEYKDRFAQLVSAFDAVSCREHAGVEICKDAGYEASKVLDPTLLLSPLQYSKIMPKDRLFKESYILIYSLNILNPESICYDDLKRYASANNLRIVVVTAKGYYSPADFYDASEVDIVKPSIGQWLNLIKNADAVVTPSFHGLVFSILFHTNFVFTPVYGEWSGGNVRVEDLFRNLEIDGKTLSLKRTYESVLNSSIDWNHIDCKLKEETDKSLGFLNNSLK